jgi:hypothetical protein
VPIIQKAEDCLNQEVKAKPQQHRKTPLKKILIQVPVAHGYNPSYSGSRDQENLSSKPAWANNSQDPILEKTLHKKGLVDWLKV